MVDAVGPSSGIASSPATLTGGAITVTYSGASDSGSGLEKVELWVRKDSGGEWTDVGMASSHASGSFNYSPDTGSGVYRFDLVSEDNAGNRSAAAAGDGDDSTSYTAVYTITGRLVLDNYTGSISSSPVTVELRKHGGDTTTTTINLSANGDFSLPDVEQGIYDLAFKASHWLREVIPGVQVGP